MKVIDLLNKIANGEEVPKKFEYEGKLYTRDLSEFKYYYRDEHFNLFEDSIVLEYLNNEVEIIEDTLKEDKKIERIDYLDFNEFSDENKPYCLLNKINEIIDKVNGETNE